MSKRMVTNVSTADAVRMVVESLVGFSLAKGGGGERDSTVKFMIRNGNQTPVEPQQVAQTVRGGEDRVQKQNTDV